MVVFSDKFLLSLSISIQFSGLKAHNDGKRRIYFILVSVILKVANT